jgi:hypothetical protein
MERPLSLTALPHELLAQIGLHLYAAEGPHSQRTLSRFTQTCKLFKELFQPLLFRSYTHNDRHISHLITFLRAIASRPDLLAAVTNLTFRFPPEVSNLTIADRDFIETCISGLGLPLPSKNWHIEFPGRTIPLQTVIAYASHNLESFSLPVNEEWDFSLLSSFLNASPKIAFPRLTNLSIEHHYIGIDSWSIPYHQIAPLLEASPNLEYLSLPTLEGSSEHQGACEIPKMKSVKALNLGENASEMFFITSLIESCDSLESFELHWLTLSEYDGGDSDWSVVKIWDALVHVKGTIQKITFESVSDIPLGSPTANSVSSLSEFTDLKILQVDGRAVEGILKAWKVETRIYNMEEFVAQLLPTGIQSLTIWAPSHTLIPALLALARWRSIGLYEGLTTVEIGSPHDCDYWQPGPEWLSSDAELREEFERAGVELKMDMPA